MASELLRHLRPLHVLLNVFGIITFKINSETHIITFSNRYLDITKVAINCLLTVFIINFVLELKMIFRNSTLFLFLSIVYIHIQAIKTTFVNITRYILKSKYSSCWNEMLKADEDFISAINHINYSVMQYPLIAKIFYIVMRNSVILITLKGTLIVNPLRCMVLLALIFFDIQFLIIRTEFITFIILIQNYFKQLEEKLRELEGKIMTQEYNTTIMSRNISKCYSKICNMSRNMLDIIWIQITTEFLEVIIIITIQGYFLLSKLYESKNTNVKFLSVPYSVFLSVDAIVTLAEIVVPSYLCMQNVSIFKKIIPSLKIVVAGYQIIE